MTPMPGAKPTSAKPTPAPPGCPQTNPLDPVAQHRERQRRYREKKCEGGKVAVGLWIAVEHRDAILESGESLQDAADEAFGLLMAKRARRAR